MDQEEVVVEDNSILTVMGEENESVEPIDDDLEVEEEEDNSDDPIEDEEIDDDSEEEEEIEEDEVEEEEAPKKVKKSGFKKRIDKLNGRVSAAQEEANYWKEQALKGKQDQEKPEPEPELQADAKPDQDDFDDYDDYVDALTDWKVDQKLSARDAKQKESKMKTEFQDRVQSFQEKNRAFVDKTEDYAEVAESVNDVTMSITVQDIIVDHENGPELMYELAKHKAEFKRICALPPLKAAIAMGNFEAKNLSNESKPKPKAKKSKAPRPMTPVKGKGGGLRKIVN